MRDNKTGLIVFAVVILLPETLWAYVGPGAGLSVLGVIFSLIAAFFLAIIGFIWYPVRRFLNRKKGLDQTKEDEARLADPPSAGD